jgi:glycosyltransferase involved in cell wall biosynthesis
MRILVFNSRDIKHPSSGGAEVFTHEVARRWVAAGDSVTLVTSNFHDGMKQEVVDGVETIRLGNYLSVFCRAERLYKRTLMGHYDAIIDEYTLRPFMAVKYAQEPVIFLVHELAREKYFYELPPILSHLGYYWFEPRWLKIYKNVPTVTVSNSTKDDLASFGFRRVDIVPEGIDFEPLERIATKEEKPTLLFVGLLKKANLVDHVVSAFRMISEKEEDAKLWIVGRGPQLAKLERMAKGLNVEFFGYIDEDKKVDLMRKAHALLVPGVREGWGLVVTEANACGTPAIGYNVPGLRDSIRDGITGLLCDSNPSSMAAVTLRFLHDTGQRENLTLNALNWSRGFSWDKTARLFRGLLQRVVDG